MKLKALCTALAFSSVLVTMPFAAIADERDDRIETLEAQVQYLMKEIESLKADRAAGNAAAAAAAPAKTDKQTQTNIAMKPSPRMVEGDFSWQPFGRIHLDYAVFDDDAADHPNGAEFRRARLGMKGDIGKDLEYKFEVDLANEAVNFKEVYLGYTGFEHTDIRVGSFKPPLGLEELTSSNYITFIERSAPTSAFSTSEIIGIGAFSGGNNWTFSAGAFNDDAGTGSSDDEAWYLAGRGTFAPVNTDEATVHLGLSAGLRKPDQANDRFDFDARAENALQTLDSVSANFVDADSAALYGFEAAYVYGPWSVQGEYFMTEVDRETGLSDLSFDGAYVQASWILTGERRPYESGKATFGRVVPDRPFDPQAGHWGAWEIAARYSELDVSDGTVLGGEMENYTFGVNWYLQKHMRLMMNYIAVDTDANAVTPDDDPQILLFRAQADF